MVYYRASWKAFVGSDAFQKQISLEFDPVTKWNYQLQKLQIPEIMAKILHC
jgi:hypothetical protein